MFPQTNELKYLLKQISQMPHAFETPSCYKLVRNYHHAQPMIETLKPKVNFFCFENAINTRITCYCQ